MHEFIASSVFSGVITSLVCVLALCLLFGLDHASYVTLLPKSVTSAMEMGEIEGAMSGLSIVISGILTVAGASLFSFFL